MPSELWHLDGVLDLLEKIDSTMPDRSFAFVLGAGASVSSGIPSGNMLAQDWLRVVHKRECMDNKDIETWLQGDPFGVRGKLSLSNAAEFYPKIFERCFRGDHDSGYAALEVAMDGKTPGMGYSLLADIIESTRHKVVVTTNFDNLVADALAMHAHKSPLVVGHEALAGFVRPYSRRPLIAKIHRDLLFSPINDQAGVDELSEPWKNALRKLFQHYTPIVIGYGGNDGSLMGLLSSLKKGEIAGQMIWCYRDELPPQALEVLNKHDGIGVKISGFDEFMLSLASRFIPSFDAFRIADRIKKMGDDRSEKYRKQTTDLHASLAQGSVEQKQAGALLASSVRDDFNWWSWQVKADAETDLQKRNAVYTEGLRRFPKNASLRGNYAYFLSGQLDDFDAAEAMYKQALALDPTNAAITGNYAALLTKQRKDFDAAEAMYKQALALDPTHATITGNYAVFLSDQRKDFDAAEAMHKQALALDPTNATTLGNYANFLCGQRKNFDAAEVLYKQALAIDPNNSDVSANFAAFLLTRGHDGDDLMSMRTLSEQALANTGSKPTQTQAEALLYLCLHAEITGTSATEPLKRLKALLRQGYDHGTWSFATLFNTVLPKISTDRGPLYRAIGAAILDATKVAELDAYPEWTAL